MQTLQALIKNEVAHLDAVQATGCAVRNDEAALLAAGYEVSNHRTFRPVASIRRGVNVANRWYDVYLTVKRGGNTYAKKLNL